MKTDIFFRADGHNRMGVGHVMRSLALSRMLMRDFNCLVAIRNPNPALRTLARGLCHRLIELPETEDDLAEAALLAKHFLSGKEIVVLDGYHFGAEYQALMRRRGGPVVCIDDLHREPFVADLIINHAGGIRPEDYDAQPYTRFCLGPDYALLHKAYLEAARIRSRPNGHRVAFVCMGGADPHNDTLKVLHRLEASGFVRQCYVVLGPVYRHHEALRAYLQESSLSVMLLENLPPEHMVGYMRLCPLAVLPPSTVALEYCCVGGALYLHQTADNQNDLRRYLLGEGLAFDLAEFPVVQPERVNAVMTRQAEVFDGQSDVRLLRAFIHLENEMHCRLRPATIDDMMSFFRWANDPETRRQSFNSKPITLAEHKHWFSRKLFDPASYLYVLEFKGQPVGQIRFDLEERAVLSYSVAPEFRGRGFGTLLIERGLARLRQDVGEPLEVVGYVKAENAASNRAFRKLGFEPLPGAAPRQAVAYRLAVRR